MFVYLQILITGIFHDDYLHLAKSTLFCVCGDVSIQAEFVQVGVYRCWVSPQSPGIVSLYMSLDGHKPISQVVNFEYRTPLLHDSAASIEERKYNWDEFRLQTRLASLLFGTQKSLDIYSSKVSRDALREARNFAFKTSNVSRSWQYLTKSAEDSKIPFPQARNALFETSLKNRLKEWLFKEFS